MKKIVLYFLLILFTSVATTSCVDVGTENFDETLLYGKWQSGTLYYTYLSDGSGKTWDTADDVTEEEAQSFTWTLDASELTHIYVLEIGGTVPKVYTVTQLTSTQLTYEDDFGTSHTFTRVENVSSLPIPLV